MNIVNVRNGKALDVEGNKDAEGQNVIVWRKHNGLNQRWRVMYLDKKTEEPTTGLDDDSGLYRNRKFYITSRLPEHRVLTV